MIFLCTIWYSGTNSLKAALNEAGEDRIHWQHCGQGVAEKCRNPAYEWVATTFRDPYEIGAAWGNRDQFYPGSNTNEWFGQWDCWGEITQLDKTKIFNIPGEPQHGYEISKKLNSFGDPHKLHEALKINDMDHYHKFVPLKLIEYAQRIIENVS